MKINSNRQTNTTYFAYSFVFFVFVFLTTNSHAQKPISKRMSKLTKECTKMEADLEKMSDKNKEPAKGVETIKHQYNLVEYIFRCFDTQRGLNTIDSMEAHNALKVALGDNGWGYLEATNNRKAIADLQEEGILKRDLEKRVKKYDALTILRKQRKARAEELAYVRKDAEIQGKKDGYRIGYGKGYGKGRTYGRKEGYNEGATHVMGDILDMQRQSFIDGRQMGFEEGVRVGTAQQQEFAESAEERLRQAFQGVPVRTKPSVAFEGNDLKIDFEYAGAQAKATEDGSVSLDPKYEVGAYRSTAGDEVLDIFQGVLNDFAKEELTDYSNITGTITGYADAQPIGGNGLTYKGELGDVQPTSYTSQGDYSDITESTSPHIRTDRRDIKNNDQLAFMRAYYARHVLTRGNDVLKGNNISLIAHRSSEEGTAHRKVIIRLRIKDATLLVKRFQEAIKQALMTKEAIDQRNRKVLDAYKNQFQLKPLGEPELNSELEMDMKELDISKPEMEEMPPQPAKEEEEQKQFILTKNENQEGGIQNVKNPVEEKEETTREELLPDFKP